MGEGDRGEGWAPASSCARASRLDTVVRLVLGFLPPPLSYLILTQAGEQGGAKRGQVPRAKVGALGDSSAARSGFPYRPATRRTLARATRSRTPLSIFASTCSCAPRVFRRASQGPQGRVVPFGGARRGPGRRLRTAVQQRRPGRVPRFIGAYSPSPAHRALLPLCLGVRDPGIAELRSVVSRVAS
jgi:hypothetical protein